MFQDVIKMLSLTVIIVFVLAVAIGVANRTVAGPTTETLAEPEWTPQVIFVNACGRTLGIIVTTEPIQFASEKHPGTPEMATLVVAARKADLAYAFNIECST